MTSLDRDFSASRWPGWRRLALIGLFAWLGPNCSVEYELLEDQSFGGMETGGTPGGGMGGKAGAGGATPFAGTGADAGVGQAGSGGTTSEGGTSGEESSGGESSGGAASGGAATECTRDEDCVPGEVCYAGVQCSDGCTSPECCLGNQCSPPGCESPRALSCAIVGCEGGLVCRTDCEAPICTCDGVFWTCSVAECPAECTPP